MSEELFDDIETLCNQIRENSIVLDKLHKNNISSIIFKTKR